MTLELARKRRDQGDLIEELAEALEPFAFCRDVQHKPAEYVTRDMAIDAGEPTMEGTMLRGVISEPCGDCDGCRARALIEKAKLLGGCEDCVPIEDVKEVHG